MEKWCPVTVDGKAVAWERVSWVQKLAGQSNVAVEVPSPYEAGGNHGGVGGSRGGRGDPSAKGGVVRELIGVTCAGGDGVMAWQELCHPSFGGGWRCPEDAARSWQAWRG